MSGERLFGTDGIRGVANTDPMVPELAAAAGRAVVRVLGRGKSPEVVIGTDTRESAEMLSCAAAAGVCSAGGNAVFAGVLPTPGIARLTAETGASAGIVISASHNPFSDNGIKIFDADGYKLADEVEANIEREIRNAYAVAVGSGGGHGSRVGRIRSMGEDAETRYLDFLRRQAPSLAGTTLAVDCANGAAHRVGPLLFQGLGAELHAIGNSPDGRNINAGCGSEHPEALCAAVKRTGADLGLALDGDGDRLVAVDDTGAVITGDQIIAVCAASMNRRGRLAGRPVVTTVMSNLGLGKVLKQMGLEHRISGVGDRRVLQEMKRCGAVLGGEDSGHLVFLERHTTGDGLYAALRLLEVILETGEPLSRLKTVMTVFPQVLINVPVARKPEIESVSGVVEAIRDVERRLGDAGRVLVRYSGTQPMCRVMVEGPAEAETRSACERIAAAVAAAIGASP